MVGSTSFLACSGSGICRYRIVRIPALANIASLWASFIALPLWVLSSSSITAITKKLGEQIAKSQYFCEYLFRSLQSVVIRAWKLTCDNTVKVGSSNALFRTRYISFSRFVRGDFLSALKLGAFLFLSRIRSANSASTKKTIASFIAACGVGKQ